MRTLLKCTGVAAAILLATACGGGGGGGETVHQVHADYPFFGSAAALTKASDVIVTATAKRVITTRRIMPEGVDLKALPEFKRAELGMVVTDVEYTVANLHKGTAGSTIVVTEIGGKIGNSLYVNDEEPNSKAGQTMLLFLMRGADGNHTVVGGAQGRYLSVNGVARTLGHGSTPGPLVGASVVSPNLNDTREISVPSVVDPGPAPAGNGGKPAIPGPPPGK